MGDGRGGGGRRRRACDEQRNARFGVRKRSLLSFVHNVVKLD